ncbi:MAG: carbohydrate kinase family protein [Candidatus Gastranaerophilales bacterium]|nr:carbohydrate kinase family protein [Candidatus Gastranaerophilales bacterium]
MYDVITIGSATLDAFIETDDANIVSVSRKDRKNEFMSYPYGSKIEINSFSFALGGGAVNTACNFANLGMKTATIIKIGKEATARDIVDMLKKRKISTKHVVVSENETTGFSVILLSFQGDRTVLAHRGPNATMSEKDIDFDAIKKSKWLYIAPLNGESTNILDKIADFAEENDVNMAINVGTSSIKRGKRYLAKILQTAEVVIMNAEEAAMLTGIERRPDTKTEKFSKCNIHPDMVKILKSLKSTKAKIVVVTDGCNGAYAYNGKHFYKCGEFPAKVVSTLGAGDAFASTFVTILEKTDWNIEMALTGASINSASVVEQFNAQDGQLTFDEIIAKHEKNPDFVAQKFTEKECGAN